MYYLTPDHFTEAAKLGIHEDLLKQRVYWQGWTIQRAITTPPRRRGIDKWDEWKEVAERHEIKRSLYHDRVIHKGWDHERAATTPVFTRKQIVEASNDVKRVFTKEQIEIAKQNGISTRTLWHRVNRFGWKIEDAITTPIIAVDESLKRARAASSWRKEKFQISK